MPDMNTANTNTSTIPWGKLLGLGAGGLGLGAAGAYGRSGSEGLFGSAPRQQQFQRFTGQQQGVQNQVLRQLMQLLQAGGNQNYQEGFAPIAAEARENFNTQTIPSLAERFTSLGEGAQRSSAFQGALGSAGASLEKSLASLGAQYGQRQQGLDQNKLFNLLQFGMQPSFEQTYTPEQPGFFEASGESILRLLPLLLAAL